ncbi:prestin isoform X2 [Prorops nasuta]
MTGKAVMAHSTPFSENLNANQSDLVTELPMQLVNTYTPMQVATAVTFLVGIFQVIMYIFQLGIISTLLSETLVNSFTTGAAVHVLISQIKDLLGLKLSNHKGYFKLIFTLSEVIQQLPNSNTAAVVISTITILIITLNNELLRKWVAKKCSMPIPIELVAVVAGTLISNYCDLSKLYNIKTVGHIPIGLPQPEVPTFELLSLVALDSVAITMVSYTITLSMALIFAQKLNYEINSNQELFAMGVSNIFGSFFSCMPVSASLSRSLIQQTVGGRTQIASVVSCLILLIILLWIGPFFEPLPRSVLAAIIIVALKGMFIQAKQIIKYWKLSKYDALIWIVTFLSVVLVGIDIGLLVGLLTSLIIILLQSIKPYTCLLGHIENSDLYLDLSRYKSAVEIPNVKIVHYCGSLNFANSQHFKSEVYKLVGINPRKLLKHIMKLARKGVFEEEQEFEDKDIVRCIILDMSAISYIDPSSVNVLQSIIGEYAKLQIQFYLANCPSPIFETVKKCNVYVCGELTFKVFATIHDAVTYTKNELFSR